MDANCLLRIGSDVLSNVFCYLDICNVKTVLGIGDRRLTHTIYASTTELAHQQHHDLENSRSQSNQTCKQAFNMATKMIERLNFFSNLRSFRLISVPWGHRRKCPFSLDLQWLPKTLTALELNDVILCNPSKALLPQLKCLHLKKMAVSPALIKQICDLVVLTELTLTDFDARGERTTTTKVDLPPSLTRLTTTDTFIVTVNQWPLSLTSLSIIERAYGIGVPSFRIPIPITHLSLSGSISIDDAFSLDHPTKLLVLHLELKARPSNLSVELARLTSLHTFTSSSGHVDISQLPPSVTALGCSASILMPDQWKSLPRGIRIIPLPSSSPGVIPTFDTNVDEPSLAYAPANLTELIVTGGAIPSGIVGLERVKFCHPEDPNYLSDLPSSLKEIIIMGGNRGQAGAGFIFPMFPKSVSLPHLTRLEIQTYLWNVTNEDILACLKSLPRTLSLFSLKENTKALATSKGEHLLLTTECFPPFIDHFVLLLDGRQVTLPAVVPSSLQTLRINAPGIAPKASVLKEILSNIHTCVLSVYLPGEFKPQFILEKQHGVWTIIQEKPSVKLPNSQKELVKT